MTPSDRLTFEKVGHLTKRADKNLQGVSVMGALCCPILTCKQKPRGDECEVSPPSISNGATKTLGFSSLCIHGCLGHSWTFHGLRSSLPTPFTTRYPNSSCRCEVDTDFISLLSFTQVGPVTSATRQTFARPAPSRPSAAVQISPPQRGRP